MTGVKGLGLRGSGVGVITRSPSTSKWIPAYQFQLSSSISLGNMRGPENKSGSF